MQIKLEVLSSETINYNDKKDNNKPKSFDVLNCREATPATVLLPFRLSARDFPAVKVGSVITLAVSEVRKGQLDAAISIRGQVIGNGR